MAQDNSNRDKESTFVKSASQSPEMVLIKGGKFKMGDVFGDGAEDEKPVHNVRLDDFYLAKCEVTVEAFRKFVGETGYRTSSESVENEAEQKRLLNQYMTGLKNNTLDDQTKTELIERYLSYSGCFWWVSEKSSFDFSTDCNWQNPYVEQTDRDPVVCMSWQDAINYCNWLSGKDGLPVAYDLITGQWLDKWGNETLDITKVKGYRLPTEAEWEYAARERGKKVRFGNGENIARSSEINFDPGRGDHPYLAKGEYAEKTKPVASYKANRLGLYDMSGNAWEWCADFYGEYSSADQINPFRSEGLKRVIRGGRWGGDAMSIRVFSRSPYESTNRCNNAGFRIALSGFDE